MKNKAMPMKTKTMKEMMIKKRTRKERTNKSNESEYQTKRENERPAVTRTIDKKIIHFQYLLIDVLVSLCVQSAQHFHFG